MNNVLVLIACIALGGCASVKVGSSQLTAGTAPPQELNAPTLQDPALTDVREVEIQLVPDRTICRKGAKTGSRIIVERCYTPSQAEEELNEYITHDTVETLREQQMYQEQARQAREAAIRRAAMGGPR